MCEVCCAFAFYAIKFPVFEEKLHTGLVATTVSTTKGVTPAQTQTLSPSGDSRTECTTV